MSADEHLSTQQFSGVRDELDGPLGSYGEPAVNGWLGSGIQGYAPAPYPRQDQFGVVGGLAASPKPVGSSFEYEPLDKPERSSKNVARASGKIE